MARDNDNILQMAAQDYQAYLRQVPLFAQLGEEEILLLASQCRRRSFGDGEILFLQGDPGHTLFVILRGSVSLDRSASLGEIVHIATRGPGDVFGEMSILDGRPRSADARTVGNTDLLLLDREGFLTCIRRSHRFAEQILVSLSMRLRESADRLAETQRLDVIGRVCAELLRLSEAEGEPRGDGILLPYKLSQQAMAERTGTTRESVNRALRRLQNEGALAVERGRLVIMKASHLRRKARV